MAKQADQVPISSEDRAFMKQCDALVPLIENNSHEKLEELARKLIWNKQLDLTHPHAWTVSGHVWDLAEGCYFDIHDTKSIHTSLTALKQAITDFNSGIIYPARYVLLVMLYHKEGERITESTSMSSYVEDGKILSICPFKPVLKTLQELTETVEITDDPKQILKRLQTKLPQKIDSWEVQEPRIVSYLIEDYATLGI